MQELMLRPTSESQIAHMFDRIAPGYDFLNRLLSFGQDQRWRQALLRRLPVCPEGLLLDVATGTGDIATMAASRQPWWQSVHGVDISENMLAQAREKLRGPVLPRKVSFSRMSAADLRLTDQSCHAVTIAFGLRNVVDKDKALHEFYRVLKPGGRLLILEFFLTEDSLLASCFRLYFRRILPVIGSLLSDAGAYRYLPESVNTFYSFSELKQQLLSSGFSDIRSQSWLFGGCRLLEASKAPLIHSRSALWP